MDQTAPAVACRYTTVAIVLHWLIAAAVLFQLGLGWRMDGPKSPETFAVVQLHKSIGITILLLSLARLGWRLAHRPPPMPALAPWERWLARITHAGFYGIMIGLPLTGWIMVSASRLHIPTLLYGVVPWPDIPGLRGAARATWSEVGHEGHEWLAYSMMLLFVLHVGGALKHQVFSRDEPILARMAPGAKAGRWYEPRLIAILVLALAALVAGRTLRLPAPHALGPAPQPAEAEPPPVAPPVAPTAASVAAPPPPPAAAAKPAVAPPAEPSRWTVAKGSTLGFETAWGGAAITGRFERWTADVRFAPDALEKSRVKVEIDMSSAVTGDSQQEGALPSADWFDAEGHPKATYIAERFEKVGEDRYVAHGRLILRGVSRPLDLPFRLKIDGDKAQVRGVTSLDRTAFGVGQGEWQSTDQIPAKVSVRVALTATRR